MNEVNKSVKKYLILFKTYLQKYIYYRASAFVWMLSDIIPFIVLIILWQAVYQNRSSIAGVSFNQMVVYYLSISFLRELIYTGGGRNTISEEIYTGQLSSLLLKPFNYLKRVFVEEISWRFIQFGLFLIPYVLLFICFKNVVKGVYNFKLWPVFILALILSFLISAFLDYLCGIGAFWLTQTSTLFHLKDIFYWLLGGLTFPQKLLPCLLQKINITLPFYYVFGFPTELIISNLSYGQIIIRFLVQLIWVIFLYLIYKLLWQKGLRKYDAWGN